MLWEILTRRKWPSLLSTCYWRPSSSRIIKKYQFLSLQWFSNVFNGHFWKHYQIARYKILEKILCTVFTSMSLLATSLILYERNPMKYASFITRYPSILNSRTQINRQSGMTIGNFAVLLSSSWWMSVYISVIITDPLFQQYSGSY